MAGSKTKAFIFLWPLAEFADVHWKRELGGILQGFARLDYRVSILVDEMSL
ncbi:hypothetical protein [Tardisphaera saccharovorans]